MKRFDIIGEDPIVVAIRAGDEQTMSLLLETEVDPNARDESGVGMTLLHLVGELAPEHSIARLVELLCSMGADPLVKTDTGATAPRMFIDHVGVGNETMGRAHPSEAKIAGFKAFVAASRHHENWDEAKPDLLEMAACWGLKEFSEIIQSA